jgi:peptide/nickel transport system permease protein
MKEILRILPKRLAIIALTLWLISIVIFGITQALPGDAAFMVLGQWASEEALSKLRLEMGLDRPLMTQYVDWLVNFIRGDFGKSLTMHLPVRPIMIERLVNSAQLGILAFLEITFLGILLGVICGIKKDSWFDQVTSTLGFIGVSIPEFVSGSLLILFFAGTVWKVFPAGGHVPLSEGFWPWLSRLILPSTTLMLVLLAYVMRMTRSSLIEVLRTNYIRTARLKGLDEKRVIFAHAMRNALMPTTTLLANNFGWLMGGIVVVETVFSYPGLGRMTILSIQKRDIPMVQASILLVAVIYISANLVADLLYMILDPRTRPSSK